MSFNYRIRVKNHLDTYWAHWFEHMTINCLQDGQAELVGLVKDQDALHRILKKIRDLNLTLLSLDHEDGQQESSANPWIRSEGQAYEIKVKSIGEPWWVGWFEEVEILSLEENEFLLTVILKDQPAMHGLLERVRAARLTLLSIRPVPVYPPISSQACA